MKISYDGSDVKVTCKFVDENSASSCVLIYREHNSTFLKVEKYDHVTEFPVSLPIKNPEIYTFAVFAMNPMNEMEPKPVTKRRFKGNTGKYNTQCYPYSAALYYYNIITYR